MAIESGPEGTRTPDLYSAIVALSQLSYRPAAREYNSAAPTYASLRFDLQLPLGVCHFLSNPSEDALGSQSPPACQFVL